MCHPQLSQCVLMTHGTPKEEEYPVLARFLFRSLLLLNLILGFNAQSEDWADASKAYREGNYKEALDYAQKGRKTHRRVEDWRVLLIRCHLMTGDYKEAKKALEEAVDDFSTYGLRIRIVGHELALATGEVNLAKSMLQDLASMAGPRTRDNATNLVAIGQAAVHMGIEPKLVLENFYNQAKRRAPDYHEVYLAGGNLALDKSDFGLAAEWFREGLKKHAEDPDLLHGLARSLATSSRSKMGEAILGALKINPNHIPSLLLIADHSIDAEQFAEAEKHVNKVLDVNPNHPDAWAYRSVLAELKNKPDDATQARERALKTWKTNPRVDFLIGLKLSQKYRFKEGAKHQRLALSFDSDYLPAQLQLAQDLLRLGEENEGWQLAEKVHEKDGYLVTAYNLTTLRDALSKFTVLTNTHFQVRMETKEASIYGDRVLQLLERARSNLVHKYRVELEEPTFVEIFNDSKDFAVRTFGMPDNPGFLGVCFGRVVTANSPAATTASPANWEAVLWHEFCHVVTLTATGNRMPRWLSEGISVYEERVEHPSWGQGLDLKYRELIKKDKLAPISKMSSAFLTPEDDDALQFAYFQAGMVVDFLIQKKGFATIQQLLADLKDGKEINASLEERYGKLAALEEEFEKQTKIKADKLADGLDTSRPEKGFTALGQDNESWEKTHPNNFHVLLRKAQKLVENKNWEEAKVALESLRKKYDGPTGGISHHMILARVYQQLRDTKAERKILESIVAMESDALDAVRRLVEICSNEKDWKSVRKYVQEQLAIDPLHFSPYLAMAKAAEAENELSLAVQSLKIALLLDPPQPAQTQFNIARLLHSMGDRSAKRHVLLALEDAPRFIEAHHLLAAINRMSSQK